MMFFLKKLILLLENDVEPKAKLKLVYKKCFNSLGTLETIIQ